MLTRHLEKQLEESRTEVECLRRRIELLGEECERVSRDKSAMLNSIARKVYRSRISQWIKRGTAVKRRVS